MDYPTQDFASTGGSGDGESSLDSPAEPDTGRPPSAIDRLVAIFSETGRIAAKGRIMFHGVRHGTGLTGSEVLTLVAIARAAQPCSVPQIGRFLGSPRQVVQRAIKVMERDGFVVPLPDKGHKRAPLMALTDKGRAAIRTVDAASRDIITTLARDLPVEGLDTTLAGLVALREQIDRTIGVQED